MSPKLPLKGTVVPPTRPTQQTVANLTRPDTHPRVDFGPSTTHAIRHPAGSGESAADADLDAITSTPAITISEIPASFIVQTPEPTSLVDYWLTAPPVLPNANAEGFRVHKGRRYVDVPDGGTVLVGVDPDTGQYRAGLPNERHASGPELLRDVDSGLWHRLEDIQPVSLPLTEGRLEAFRTDLDFSDIEPDSDGFIGHAGKRYVVIQNHAYQAMQDLDLSTPEQKVWRIVRPKDPVATDNANIYRAIRRGKTLAIAQDKDNTWVSVFAGLRGGMRRNESAHVNKALLLQRYEPIANAHRGLSQSNNQYATLWSEIRQLPEGSAEKNVALVKLEVHLLKHIKMQTDFIKSLIDNKDWLIHLKAGGRYREELHTFQMEQVNDLNKLMAIMDFRVMPTVTGATIENCKKTIAHLNKKLKLLDDRQAVIEQIKKASPGAAFELAEISSNVPGADRINYSKLTIYLRLLSDNPENPPDTGMQSLRAIDMFTEDLNSTPARDNPLALLLAADQIREEKHRFELQLSSARPDKATYIQEIIALLDPFEKKIDSRLTEIFDPFNRNNDWPSLDQDVDFDFIPQQSINAGAAQPSAARKVFRTRQHGADRVLVGEKETAADGNVTIKVANLFRPNDPPQHYEKRQGEWRPVRPLAPSTPRPQLIDDSNRLLARAEERLVEAKAREAQETNPTEILEFLDDEADRLHDQARLLKNHPDAGEDTEIADLVSRLKSAGDSLSAEGKKVLVRMYKKPDVLDILRLNFLLDHAELTASKVVDRKPLGKGDEKYFLDVYLINDRSGSAALWEAHFKYDRHDSAALNFKVKGAHLKTLEQGGRGLEAQRRDAEAGLPHIAIWRESFDGKTAKKIFDLAV